MYLLSHLSNSIFQKIEKRRLNSVSASFILCFFIKLAFISRVQKFYSQVLPFQKHGDYFQDSQRKWTLHCIYFPISNTCTHSLHIIHLGPLLSLLFLSYLFTTRNRTLLTFTCKKTACLSSGSFYCVCSTYCFLAKYNSRLSVIRRSLKFLNLT